MNEGVLLVIDMLGRLLAQKESEVAGLRRLVDEQQASIALLQAPRKRNRRLES